MADIDAVDVWQDFDFVTLNDTNLAANDHATVGTWTVIDPETKLSTSTSGEKISTGLIGGNSDSGGTRGLAFTPSDPADNTHVTYEFSEDKSSCSYGFWYQFPASFIGSDEEHDLLYVENALGSRDLVVKHCDHTGRAGHLYLWTDDEEYSSAIEIGGMDGEWIWITALHQTGGAGSPHRLRAYDVDGNQIGSEMTRASNATEPSHTVYLGSAVGALVGHTGSLYFDDFVIDWTDATFPLGPPVATGTVDQEGFRWGVDDDTESAHTFEAAQDTSITIAADQSRLLRVLLDGTDDPGSAAYTLRYQKNGSGGYVAVPVGATTDIVPTPTSADVTEGGSNTAGTSWTVAHPNASTGDLLLFMIAWDDSTNTTDVAEPAGPNAEVLSEINATPSTNNGTTVRCKGWYTIATGSWTAGNLTFTASASEQRQAIVVRIPAGQFDATTPLGTVAVTSSGASTTDMTVQSAALNAGATDGPGRLFMFCAVDVDPVTATPSGWTEIVGGAGVDIGAVASGVWTRDAIVTDSESIAAQTTGWSIGSSSWSSVTFVLRGTVSSNEVYIATSANITAGGEATTARLTAPAGKTTSNFTTGRRWDNENGSDSIDIEADEYTELEWLVYVAASASADDFFDFRVYGGSNALDTYTVTPRWTIPSEGGGVSILPLVARGLHGMGDTGVIH